MYEIEKDVPLPTNNGMGSTLKYPSKIMDVGDSFFIKDPITSNKRNIAAALNKARKPKRFIGRTVDGGIRIWRVL